MANFNAPKTQRQRHAACPSAYTGDEVFFQKGGQPVSGKVLCAGKHGCTIEHGGKRYKVRHEHVIGHKKRAQQRYQVVEEGEDGLVVQDQSGKRRYVGIPPEARTERLTFSDLGKPGRPGA